MNRFLQLLYALVAYVFFLAAFLYLIGFVGNLFVPKMIDSGTQGPWQVALIIDLALIGIFALQHTVMARPAFKRWWTKIILDSIERSVPIRLTHTPTRC